MRSQLRGHGFNSFSILGVAYITRHSLVKSIGEGRKKRQMVPNIAYFCAMVLRNHCTGHCSGLYGKYRIPVRGRGVVLALGEAGRHPAVLLFGDCRAVQCMDSCGGGLLAAMRCSYSVFLGRHPVSPWLQYTERILVYTTAIDSHRVCIRADQYASTCTRAYAQPFTCLLSLPQQPAHWVTPGLSRVPKKGDHFCFRTTFGTPKTCFSTGVGVRDLRVCVPKLARSDVPNGKFWFFHDALIILNIHKWGKFFQTNFLSTDQLRAPSRVGHQNFFSGFSPIFETSTKI